MIALSQADLIALLGRTFPPAYLSDLLAGAGGEVLYAAAAVMARVSTATVRMHDGLTPGSAPLGAIAVGTVSLARTGTAAGTLYAGSVLWDINGERLMLTQDAAWGAGDVAPKVVTVLSVRRSWQGNMLAGTVLAVRTALDAAFAPTPLFDTTILGAVVALAGGTSPALEGVCTDRDVVAQFGESAPALRERFREQPDNLTPNAIQRAAVKDVPGAVLVEWPALVGYAFGESMPVPAPDGAFFVGGDVDPTSAFAARRPPEQAILNCFLIRVPATDAEPQFFYAGFNYALTPNLANPLMARGAGAACPPVMTARTFEGRRVEMVPGVGTVWYDATYDMGNPGDRPDVARMSARVEAARAAGIRWWIEEE